MKTTVSVFKDHYLECCQELKEKINVVSSECYDVVDIFHRDYVKDGQDKVRFGTRVAQYMKGWWGDVLEGGLIQKGVDPSQAKEIQTKFFDELLPPFVSEQTDNYPEFYNVLALNVQKV